MSSIWIRRAAIAVGVLLVLLLAAAGLVIATFDANRYKSLAIDWMRTEHQRTLAVDGPTELSLFPRLAVKVSRLRLSERGREDEFAAIDEASVAVQLLPLLRDELVLGRLSARGVRANYLRDAKGARNIDDLLTGSAGQQGGTAKPTAGQAPLRIQISSVQFDDLHLHVRDEMTPLAGDVVLQTFTSGRLADRTETPVSLRGTARLTRPAVANLALDGRMTLGLELDRNGIALSAMKLDVEGEVAGVKALALALEGALAWDGHALRAGPLTVALRSAEFGAVALTSSKLAVKQALFSPGGQRLELDSLVVALGGRRGGDPFEMTLDWPRLAVDAQQLEGSALSGRVKLEGASPLAGEFSSAAPSGKFDALRLPDLALALAGRIGPRQVDAHLKADLVLDAGRSAAAIEQLQLRATLAEPAMKPLNLTLQGSGHASAQSADWQLNGLLNADRFEVSGSAVLGGKVPGLKADARFDSLDLNTLFAPDGSTPRSHTATAPADTPVPLDSLQAVDGQFSLDAGTLVFRQYRVADAKVSATLDGGKLRVTRLAGRAWGGSFEGSGSAEAASRRVALKLDARGVNVDALLKNVAGKDLLEGTGHVVADLVSSGATIGALRSNLSGRAAVQLRDGAIKGFNLARALRQVQAALSRKQDAIAQSSAVEKTDFSEMHASARIAGGVARSDDLELTSPFLRLTGAGSFDIGRGRIDYTARATVTEAAVAQGGGGLEALRGVTVPVQLSGPFDAIDWKVQWSGLASAAIQNKLRDKLGEVLGTQPRVPPARADAASAPRKPEDVLKDRLRGLLK